jgi:hypothetical protein
MWSSIVQPLDEEFEEFKEYEEFKEEDREACLRAAAGWNSDGARDSNTPLSPKYGDEDENEGSRPDVLRCHPLKVGLVPRPLEGTLYNFVFLNRETEHDEIK